MRSMRLRMNLPRVTMMVLFGMIASIGTAMAGATDATASKNEGEEGMSIDGSYNFRRVSDKVTTSGVVGDKRLANLQAQGYGAVINLLPDESEYAVPEEGGIVTSQGLRYFYIPVDFAAPTQADFEAFVQAMDTVGDKTAHVHCAANFRVSAFYSLYAMRKGLWTAEQADKFIEGLWNPAEHPAWTRFIGEQRARR